MHSNPAVPFFIFTNFQVMIARSESPKAALCIPMICIYTLTPIFKLFKAILDQRVFSVKFPVICHYKFSGILSYFIIWKLTLHIQYRFVMYFHTHRYCSSYLLIKLNKIFYTIYCFWIYSCRQYSTGKINADYVRNYSIS